MVVCPPKTISDRQVAGGEVGDRLLACGTPTVGRRWAVPRTRARWRSPTAIVISPWVSSTCANAGAAGSDGQRGSRRERGQGSSHRCTPSVVRVAAPRRRRTSTNERIGGARPGGGPPAGASAGAMPGRGDQRDGPEGPRGRSRARPSATAAAARATSRTTSATNAATRTCTGQPHQPGWARGGERRHRTPSRSSISIAAKAVIWNATSRAVDARGVAARRRGESPEEQDRQAATTRRPTRTRSPPPRYPWPVAASSRRPRMRVGDQDDVGERVADEHAAQREAEHGRGADVRSAGHLVYRTPLPRPGRCDRGSPGCSARRGRRAAASWARASWRSVRAPGFGSTFVEGSDELVAAGRARVERSLQSAVARGKLADDARDAALGRIEAATDLAALADGRPGDRGRHRGSRREARDLRTARRAITRPEVVLASNTSSIPIATLGEAAERGARR